MRLERLTMNKFKVFLTFDDMRERGITKEDLWQDVPKVHDLFRDMMLEADDELGFKVDGPLAVEVFAVPAQGMVIIVTKGISDSDLIEDDFDEGFIEMQVTLDESDQVFYEFSDSEDVIALASRLYPLGVIGGSFYVHDGTYYMKFEDYELDMADAEAFIALLSEFGSPATISIYRVEEYGKKLIKNEAIYKLYESFFQK